MSSPTRRARDPKPSILSSQVEIYGSTIGAAPFVAPATRSSDDRTRPFGQQPPMMHLRTSPLSPFGRKVALAASLLGLEGQIRSERADTMDPADSLRRQNPLGKIPVLILDDGRRLFDSRVILEYLDHCAGGGRIRPAEP